MAQRALFHAVEEGASYPLVGSQFTHYSCEPPEVRAVHLLVGSS
jgi:hypothetical protein